MAVGHGVSNPLTSRAPAVTTSHRRGAEGFIEKDQPLGVNSGLQDAPVRALKSDVGPILFAGVNRFF